MLEQEEKITLLKISTNYPGTICPKASVEVFKDGLYSMDLEVITDVLEFLRTYDEVTARLYCEIMALLPSYDNPGDFISYKM